MSTAGSGAAPRPPRSLRRTFASIVLVGEVLVIGFATLVAKDQSGQPTWRVLVAAAVLVLLCLAAAGRLSSRTGYLIGWVVQVLLLASALWVHLMALIGLVFLGLWVLAVVEGGKADVVTARRVREEEALRAEGRLPE